MTLEEFNTKSKDKKNRSPREDCHWEPKFTGSPIYDVPLDSVMETERDPRFREIVNEEALGILKQRYPEIFNKHYSGVSSTGYLLDKEGKETNSLPEQNITIEYEELIRLAQARFGLLYPESVKKYESKKIR